jgi:hypothetical protein
MRQIVLVVLLCLLVPFLVQADISTQANRNLESLTLTAGALHVAATATPADAACKTVVVNAQGTANSGIAVDSTAGGVPVLAASTTRCGALLYNLQGGGDVLCGPTTITVTTTVGFYLAAGQSLALGNEGQQAWRCIRQGSTNGTVYVAESTS